MRILGYGEDALTLWALRKRTPDILRQLGDRTNPSDYLVFYRPSFGRKGGSNRAEFGEFDFILVTRECVYLGESKWDHSSEVKDQSANLREEQTDRHRFLRWYVNEWLRHGPKDWGSFAGVAREQFKSVFPKKLAPNGSILAGSLETILNEIQAHVGTSSIQIRDVLLFLHNSRRTQPLTAVNTVPPDIAFDIVNLDYSSALRGSLIEI